jgi:hypothetical protein
MLYNTGIQLEGNGQYEYPALVFKNNSDNGYNNIWAAQSRPNTDSGSADYTVDDYLQDGDVIFRFFGAGYQGTQTNGGQTTSKFAFGSATVDLVASEDHSASQNGGKIVFKTLDNGTVASQSAETAKMTINDNVELNSNLDVFDNEIRSSNANVVIRANSTDKEIHLKVKDEGGSLQTAAEFRDYDYVENTTNSDETSATTRYDTILDIDRGIRIGSTANEFSSTGASPNNNNSAYNLSGIIVGNTGNTWPAIDIISNGQGVDGSNPLRNQYGDSFAGGAFTQFPNGQLNFKASNGTAGAIAALGSGKRMGQMNFYGHDTAGFGGSSATPSIAITGSANETFSTSNSRGGKLEIEILPTGGSASDGNQSSDRRHVFTAVSDSVNIGDHSHANSFVTVNSGTGFMVFDSMDIDLNGRKITTEVTNGAVNIEANGTGNIVMASNVEMSAGKLVLGQVNDISNHSINGLSDVNITSVAQGDILNYNSSTGNWENVAAGVQGANVNVNGYEIVGKASTATPFPGVNEGDNPNITLRPGTHGSITQTQVAGASSTLDYNNGFIDLFGNGVFMDLNGGETGTTPEVASQIRFGEAIKSDNFDTEAYAAFNRYGFSANNIAMAYPTIKLRNNDNPNKAYGGAITTETGGDSNTGTHSQFNNDLIIAAYPFGRKSIQHREEIQDAEEGKIKFIVSQFSDTTRQVGDDSPVTGFIAPTTYETEEKEVLRIEAPTTISTTKRRTLTLNSSLSGAVLEDTVVKQKNSGAVAKTTTDVTSGTSLFVDCIVGTFTTNAADTIDLYSSLTDTLTETALYPTSTGSETGGVTQTGPRATFLEPVVFANKTTTERNALTATAGMVIFNTTDSKLQVHNGSTWVDLH